MFQCARQQPKFERTTLSKWIGQSWQIKNQLELLLTLLKEMVKVVQKYNASISGMRASTNQRLKLPTFFHPYAKNKHVQNNSKVMSCPQLNSVDTGTSAQTWWGTGSESWFYQLKDPANTWSLSW